jgi:uncharacterized protein (TIGR02246 family)
MKKLYSPIGFLIVALFSTLAIACGSGGGQVVQQQPDTRDDDEAAIQAASKEWSAAEAAKDLPKCLSFYADDAERMSPGSPTITGKEDLRREWEKFLAAPGTFNWTTAKIEVARSGDLAYETGVYESKTLDNKKQPVTNTGKYVLIWEKQDDGKWKVTEDIDNPDK